VQQRSGRRCSFCLGLGEVGARLVRHVGHGTGDFSFGQRAVAALGRHRALAIHGRRNQRFQAGCDAAAPGGVVAQLRRTGSAGVVTGGTGCLVDLRTGLRTGRGRFRFTQFNACHRLDRLRDDFGVGRVQSLEAGQYELGDQHRNTDKHYERQYYDHYQLLRRLDERLMLFVRVRHVVRSFDDLVTGENKTRHYSGSRPESTQSMRVRHGLGRTKRLFFAAS
jgi:hypothetical protein